jgi:disulfide bond formation protein DsbB
MEITQKHFIGFGGAVATLSLIIAFGFEYWGGLQPCHLCQYQRYIYGMIVGLSFLGFFFPARYHKYFVWGIALLFASECIAALYHVGVEHRWIDVPAQCTAHFLQSGPLDFEAMKAQILKAVPPRCDEVSWRFLGLSMAEHNVIFSGSMAILIGGFKYVQRFITGSGAKI